MAKIALSELRTEVRNRADMEESEFVTDSELNSYINKSWHELYDILTAAYEDYYTLPPVTFTLASGESTFDIPTDFYKLRGIDGALNGSTDFFTLAKFNFNRRNRKSTAFNGLQGGQFSRTYRLIRDKVYISPDDNADGEYRFWYVPQANDLVIDTDEMDGVNGWEEYVIVDAAIKALNKEESDVSVLLAQKAALQQRIITLSKNRDAGTADTITDVDIIDLDEFLRR